MDDRRWPGRAGLRRLDRRAEADQDGAAQARWHAELDSADGYREAAEQTDDAHYRTLFQRRAAERQQIADDLSAAVRGLGGDPESDPLYDQAVEVVLKNRRASISLVQRHLRIGYNRSARLIEAMEQAGLVSAMDGRGGREVLVRREAE